MFRPSGSDLRSRTEESPRGRGSRHCLLLGGLNKPRHIHVVFTALIVRVQCFRKDMYRAVEGPSTRPIVLSMITFDVEGV